MTDLERLKSLAEKATPGPWQCFEDGRQNSYADAEFIAACSPDVIVRLIGELVAAKEVIEAARQIRQTFKQAGWTHQSVYTDLAAALAVYDQHTTGETP
jgi:hypothetical protein